jgi:hypothetical protein
VKQVFTYDYKKPEGAHSHSKDKFYSAGKFYEIMELITLRMVCNLVEQKSFSEAYETVFDEITKSHGINVANSLKWIQGR